MGKTKSKKIDPKQYKEAAAELEELLSPENDDGTPTKMTKGTTEEIKEKIIEAAEELNANDEISDNLKAVLEDLGVEIPESDEDDEEGEEKEDEDQDADEGDEDGEDEEDPNSVCDLSWDDINGMKKKKDVLALIKERKIIVEPEEHETLDDLKVAVADALGVVVPKDEEDEDDEEPGEEKSLVDLVKETTKLDHLKTIIANNDEFKKLRKGLDKYKGLSGPRELKPKMFECLGVNPEKEKPVKKEKTETKMTRIDAVIQTIKQGKTTDPEKIVPKANELYVANGGKDNLKESVWATNLILKVVNALGVSFK